MSYQKAISTLGCPERDLPAVAALARKHGLDGVELRMLEGTADLPALFARRHGRPAALAVAVAQAGVRIVALGTSFRLTDEGETERAALLAFGPWAEALGVKWLRVFDGGKPGDAAARATMQAGLDWWRKERAARGWQCDLMVETHDSLFTAGAIREFAGASGAAILWDTHHTWRRGGEDPVATWTGIQPHVVHVHVKDSVSRPSARHPYTYVLPGEGEFPAAPLRKALQGGFAGIVSLEWEKQWHPRLPPLEEALAAAAFCGWW